MTNCDNYAITYMYIYTHKAPRVKWLISQSSLSHRRYNHRLLKCPYESSWLHRHGVSKTILKGVLFCALNQGDAYLQHATVFVCRSHVASQSLLWFCLALLPFSLLIPVVHQDLRNLFVEYFV